jgi:2',3'-cyclic-nucleotide 2'-phosphodiesterase (5'-nucleotidase family)
MYSTVKHILWFAVVVFFTACSTPVKDIRMEATLISVDNRNDPDLNLKIQDFLIPYKQKLENEMNETIAFSSESILNGVSESPLGNLFADILMKWGISSKSTYPLPHFSLLNSGGIRSPFPKGAITLYNVYQAMPFDNTVAFAFLNPSSLNKLAAYIAKNNNVVLGNARFKAAPGTAEILISEGAFPKNKMCVVITSDYLARGGDHMDFFTEADSVLITDVLIRDVLSEHLKLLNSNIEPKNETRIEIRN